MSNPKMTKCKVCGSDIAKNAKVCPNCGAKNKKPIYQRPWFIILAILVVFGMFGTCGGSGKSSSGSTSANSTKPSESSNTGTVTEKTPEPTPEPVEYTVVSISQMKEELESNALKAKETYKGQYIEITGTLINIDASGKYIDLGAGDPYEINGIQCYIKSDEQKAQVAEMKTGDTVTLRGKCKDVGELMGYSLDIDSIDGFEATEKVAAETVDGYITVTADQLSDELKANALGAKQTYEGNMVAVSGRLSNIDASGKYINVSPVNDPYSFTFIQCYVKSEEIKSAIMDLSIDETITVKGKCTSVGEVMGYSIDIESIER